MSNLNSNFPLSPEQKQHVNISQYAYDIIVSDSITFMGKINISGFVNAIVSNSGTQHLDDLFLNEKARIEEELLRSNMRISDLDQNTIDKISLAHLSLYIEMNSTYPKEKSFKIRLQNELYEDLYPINGKWAGSKHQIRQGEYIKAILEDYSRKPIFDRESIYYKDTIDYINQHIASDSLRKGILPILLDNGNKVYLKPYRFSEDFEAPYHYLIGLSSYAPESGYIPTSIRLSRIKNIKRNLTSYASGKITNKESRELERRIKINKIPYILGETVQFKIRLNSVGINMYNSIFHQRPMYDDITDICDGAATYIFNSTERQITNYFFPFGENAMILSPQKTANYMLEKYRIAYESYACTTD